MADGNHVTCFFCIKVMLHVLYKKIYSKRGFTSASCQLLFLYDFSNISEEFILSSTCLWLFQSLLIYFMCWHVGVFQPKRHVDPQATPSVQPVTSVVWLGAAGMSIVKQLHITTRLTTSKGNPKRNSCTMVSVAYIDIVYVMADINKMHLRERERDDFLIGCVYIYI